MTQLAISIWNWFLSRHARERPVKDAAEKLQMSMRVTAKCRYNAAVRLQRQGKFAFFTTTVLSLGLIFIPLMQNAGVPLAYKSNVLNMMQIFLAVSVLVYSGTIGDRPRFSDGPHKMDFALRNPSAFLVSDFLPLCAAE